MLNDRNLESEPSILEGKTANATNTALESMRSLETLSVQDACLSIFLFICAGLFEVGGGYLVWIAIRDNRRQSLFLPLGLISLMIYGIIPVFQPVDSFGRVFAVYGGFFIVLSYVWAVLLDGMVLDKGDYIGGTIALVGVSIAWFWPR